MSARIKTDDEVIVISGKDRGKTGKVLRAEPKKNRVYVEGLNIVKRHVRPTRARRVVRRRLVAASVMGFRPREYPTAHTPSAASAPAN